MWQCTAERKTIRKSPRIFIVISVIFCIFLMYTNMNNSISTYTEFQPTYKRKVTNMTQKSDFFSKDNVLNYSTDNVSLFSNLDYDPKAVNNSRLENDIFEWLLDFKTDVNDTITELTNASEIEKKSVLTTKLTNTPSLKHSPFTENQYGNKDTDIRGQTYLSRVTNWMKFKNRPSFGKQNLQLLSLFPFFNTFNKSAYDIMNMEPLTFDPAYKNPCFKGTDSTPIKDGQLHCLPYFYIIGVKKSGTSDLYSRLRRHPEICTPSFPKESQWFSRFRFGIKAFSMNVRKIHAIFQRGIDPRKVDFFISLFDSAASCIQRSPSRDVHDSLHYNKITVEASPSTLHMQTKWEMLPGNENISEPRYTNFNYIKHITPNAKIIILFRNPTSRLYSDFLHSTGGKYGNSSATVFHKDVIEIIKAYKNCFNHFSHRSCVYNNTLKSILRDKRLDIAESFNAGFYAVFMKDLLSVFGTSQILPILMSDYVTKMKQTLESVFDFLDISSVGSLAMRRILNLKTKNVSTKKRRSWPMLESTKTILDDFFRPFNEDMAEVMKDKRYLFLD
ncbi:carbohydrate sulfotransferase 15-like [Ruditapes philippinarum]|uniref:carbohydrate sulfotransferase 15-like n=1 Tax=Ruditapes philippinarum TaxID=129788 RepID=UPI00295B97C1|nr:carbohydrate sulfotransferase 15-like [Ruditapes philippinarum]